MSTARVPQEDVLTIMVKAWREKFPDATERAIEMQREEYRVFLEDLLGCGLVVRRKWERVS